MRRAELRIDGSALRHNAEIARRAAGERQILAAVKADGYGHGLSTMAHALRESVDGLMVASLGEGEALRQAGVTQRIVVLQGVMSQAEARRAAQRFLEPVFHHVSQIEAVGTAGFGLPLTAWIKLDSGMHRVGFTPVELPEAYARLSRLRGIQPHPGVLTHFARADEPDRYATEQQIRVFHSALDALTGFDGETSLCNSAGLLAFPEAGGDWVRPGIMLYGGNPFVTGTAADHGLRPVMTLTTRLIAIRHVAQGEAVGYGGRFVAPEAMPVGVAAIGYGDGYPRHAPDGTPIYVNGQRAAVVGRVSMDLVTIDLRGITARVGDEVECWGGRLPIDDIAASSGTISYELMCQMSGRVHRTVID